MDEPKTLNPGVLFLTPQLKKPPVSSWALPRIGSSLSHTVVSTAGPSASHACPIQLYRLLPVLVTVIWGPAGYTPIDPSVTPTGIWSNIQYSCETTLFPVALNGDTWNLVISRNGSIFEILDNQHLSHHSFLSLYSLFLTSTGPALQLWGHPPIEASIPSQSPFCLNLSDLSSLYFAP